jgi:co-chaperonin GroES (HSP10)
MKAFGEKVILELVEEESTTKNGIIKVEYKKTDKQGIVQSVGQKVKSNIQVGDIALFQSFSGKVFTHNDKKYMSINNQEILAVIRKDTN